MRFYWYLKLFVGHVIYLRTHPFIHFLSTVVNISDSRRVEFRFKISATFPRDRLPVGRKLSRNIITTERDAAALDVKSAVGISKPTTLALLTIYFVKSPQFSSEVCLRRTGILRKNIYVIKFSANVEQRCFFLITDVHVNLCYPYYIRQEEIIFK